MDIIPIWKDYPITITTNDPYVDYTISLGVGGRDGVIYSGRAYKLPGATTVRIVPNEVCAPYVSTNDRLYVYEDYLLGRMAQVFTLSAPGKNYSVTFAFGADRTYTLPIVGRSNDPITGRMGYDAPIPISAYNVHYNPNDDNTLFFGYTLSAANGYSTFISKLTGALSIESSTKFLRYPSYEKLEVYGSAPDPIEYRLLDICAKYYLYYINAYGAWDAFMIEGAGKKTDDYNRTTFEQSYSTVPPTDGVLERGTVCLQNDITRKYTLVTGWLTDDQASRMHHLLGSTNVYLLDVEENRYLPVILTNSSCEYKTYRNQGAQLVNYTIEATVAQNFTRR